MIRSEPREGAVWYELVHDGLIDPIRKSNLDWYRNQPLGQRLAREFARHKTVVIGVVALVAMMIAGFTAHLLIQSTEQEFEARTRLAKSYAEQATNPAMLAASPPKSLLLAVEALDFKRSAFQKPLIPEKEEAEMRVQLIEALAEVISKTGSLPLVSGGTFVQKDVDPARVSVSSDGKWVAAVDVEDEGVVHIWELSENSPEVERRPLRLTGSPVSAMAFGPVSDWLFIGHSSGALDLVKLSNSGSTTRTLLQPGPNGPVQMLSSSQGSSIWLAIADNEGVHLYKLDAATESAARVAHLSDGHSDTLMFSPDGRWLATVDSSDTLRLWDLDAEDIVASGELPLSEGKNGMVAFSQRSRWLAAANSGRNLVYLWQLPVGSARIVYLIDPATYTQSTVQSLDMIPYPFALPEQNPPGLDPPDGWLAVGYGDGKVMLWTLPTEVQLEGLRASAPSGDPYPKTNDISDQSTTPVAFNVSDVLHPFILIGHGSAISAQLSVGQKLVTASSSSVDNPRLCLWDLGKLEPLLNRSCRPLNAHEDAVVAVYSGQDPSKLITVDSHTVRYWDMDEDVPKGLEQMERLACKRAGRSYNEDEIVHALFRDPNKDSSEAACDRILRQTGP